MPTLLWHICFPNAGVYRSRVPWTDWRADLAPVWTIQWGVESESTQIIIDINELGKVIVAGFECAAWVFLLSILIARTAIWQEVVYPVVSDGIDDWCDDISPL